MTHGARKSGPIRKHNARPRPASRPGVVTHRPVSLDLAQSLMKKSPYALRYTKEAIRAVRDMSVGEAADYLESKSDALKHRDPEKGREKAMKQFIDEKTFKPGFGDLSRR